MMMMTIIIIIIIATRKLEGTSSNPRRIVVNLNITLTLTFDLTILKKLYQF